ncbi:preprotein translocase subunit SecE [Gordonia sp. CPCC 206044]|uniref:preprotein translocase subunit SecE n=1 Tax=Gordonia sp. CPCC 206044 TaxID=3140793 RepID=UPI003AF381C1
MSKRDRAARAKDSAEASSADAVEELESREDAAGAAEESTELRPSGKRSSRRRSSASASATGSDTDSDGGSAVAVAERKKKAPAEKSRNPFVRIWLFLQQVVSELKKVIWPSRREMITYTIVVLVFVVIMTAFISGIDLGFAKLVLLVFG